MAAQGRLFRRALAGLSAVAALWPTALFGLDPSRRVDQYTLDVWSAETLATKTIFAIEETPDGYLWLGTGGGLLRYDGFRFTLFEPANTPAFDAIEVRALHAAASGDLWIGIYGGGVLRLHEGAFDKVAGLPSPLVRALAEGPDGSLWAGMQGRGVARIAGLAVAETIDKAAGLPSDDVRALAFTRRGDLWIGAERGGATRRRDGRLESFVSGLPGSTVMAFSEAADGGIWIATTRGLVRWSEDAAGTYQVEPFGPAEGLDSDYIFALGGDRQGNLWVGTGGAGVFRYAGGRFSGIGSTAGLPGDYVWALHEDAGGALWVGAEGGLARLRDGLFVLWGARQGLAADQVHGLLEDRHGAIWIAGPKGLTRWADGAFRLLGKAAGLPDSPTRALLETRDGALWVSSESGGVTRLRDGQAETFGERDGLDSTVWSLAEDRDGVIWAGTQKNGVARFSGGRWRTISRPEGLGAETVRVLLADRERGVWAGTAGGGLARLEGDRVTARYTTRDGLGGDAILSLYQEADGRLWVGTLAGGLSLFTGGRFVTYDRRHGFFADGIGSIVEDGLGHLWFSAKGGPYRVSRRALLDLFESGAPSAAGLEALALGPGSGIRGSPGTGFTPAVFRTRDGRLLYPTSAGVAVIHPRAVGPPPGPAPPLVEALFANHRETPLRPPPVLPAGTFDLEIRYTAPSLVAPGRTRFRYRLEGYDRDWVEVAERRSAYYPNLPPGEYVFRVAASDVSGGWGREASLPLTLEPYFWQTQWFRALLAGLGAWALYGLYRLRAGRLEARAAVAEERNRLAREIHDTLAQDLAAILTYARQGLAATAEPERSAPIFEDIAALATGSLAEARRSLQALRPPALDDRQLSQALEEVAHSLAAARGAEATVRADLAREPGPAAAAELLRIAKEALGNALRHGGARRVEVELMEEGGELVLRVRDDGAGFDPQAPSTGYGLLGMRERAAALGGRLVIASAPGSGATVEARVPLGGPA